MQKKQQTEKLEPVTLGQALNSVLSGRVRRLDIEFIDAWGNRFSCAVYNCGVYSRADFRPVESPALSNEVKSYGSKKAGKTHK